MLELVGAAEGLALDHVTDECFVDGVVRWFDVQRVDAWQDVVDDIHSGASCVEELLDLLCDRLVAGDDDVAIEFGLSDDLCVVEDKLLLSRVGTAGKEEDLWLQLREAFCVGGIENAAQGELDFRAGIKGCLASGSGSQLGTRPTAAILSPPPALEAASVASTSIGPPERTQASASASW